MNAQRAQPPESQISVSVLEARRSGCLDHKPLTAHPSKSCPAYAGRSRVNERLLPGRERARHLRLDSGHAVRIGAVTEQPDEWLTAIANGYGIAIAPGSAARYYAHPGVTYRPVTGVSRSQVGVAWLPAADNNTVIQDFVRCCLDHKPPPIAITPSER